MENIRQKIAEIITYTHKTPLEQADEILDLFAVGGAERKLVCPHCKSSEENFTRNGHHVWCRNCDYEFNVG